MPSSQFSRRAILVAGSAWAFTACASTEPHPLAGSANSIDAPSSISPTISAEAEVSSTPSAQASTQSLDHTTPSSVTVLVNKHHPLNPVSWAPDDLVDFGGQQLRAEAAEAGKKMLDAAAQAGYQIAVISGYRSYDTQVATYQGWVAQEGHDMADVASARPGHSEHQTGLAFDAGTGGSCDLQPCFGQTPEAQWLAEHCHDYGFILRFPWQLQDTTGYWYESWHFRYIGLDQAKQYHSQGATCLENFWSAEPAPNYL